MSYADMTLNDPNAVKRYMQRRRFRSALLALSRLGKGADRVTVLDWGCGHAALYHFLKTHCRHLSYVGYDPSPAMLEEARESLGPDREDVVLVSNEAELTGTEFDMLFCLEVFEHLDDDETRRTLDRWYRLLPAGAGLAIGVPNEIHVPALVRGGFRMARRYGSFDARPAAILAAALGRPPCQRPWRTLPTGAKYCYYHMGFDHRRLLPLVQERFPVVRVYGSPWPGLPVALNTEVNIVAHKPG